MGCKKLILKDDLLYVINGRGGFDPSLLPGGGGGGGVWGSITGTLSDQTDVQLALDAKAPLNSPTFTGTPVVPGYLTTATAGTTYMPLAGGAFTGSVDMGTSTNFSLYGVGNNAASNYERFRIFWSSNILNLSTQEGGTGEFRAMFMNIASAGLLIGVSTSNAGIMRITTSNVSAGSLFGVIGTMTGSTAITQNGLVVAPAINQTGSANSNALLISPYALATPNTQYLINAGTNSTFDNGGTHTKYFSVDLTGKTIIGNAASNGAQLQVQGTATFSQYITIPDSADGIRVGANTTLSRYGGATFLFGSTVSFGTTGQTFMQVQSAGDVIIQSSGSFSSNAAVQLQVNSTTRGVLFPRMTTAQKNAISTPPAGLIVFDTDLSKLCVRGASAWETITST